MSEIGRDVVCISTARGSIEIEIRNGAGELGRDLCFDIEQATLALIAQSESLNEEMGEIQIEVERGHLDHQQMILPADDPDPNDN